mmetsp:Transcript_263/g.269  ORF Transcript_263/g.269 Transcript_263/m.269 type:complete len:128 (-) Transcript_263:330-713(-)
MKNYKKEAMIERRYTEIERENRILLEKMSNIMQQTRGGNPNMTGGFGKRSLNREVRKKELLKITVENQQMLKRLQDKQSNYSVARWEEDFKSKERMMKNMCEYPLVFDERNLQSAGALDYASEGRGM